MKSLSRPLFLFLLSVTVHGLVCPLADDQTAKYHSGDATFFNLHKESLNRHEQHQRLMESKTSAQVPNERSVICPETPQLMRDADQVDGMDTTWIVENSSDVPVVLAFVSPDGTEASARNPSITPPERDPNSILAPGDWMPVYTYEGHVFHARELNEDGSGGRLVLQHRVGLVPIGINAKNLNCPASDPEPVVNATRAPIYARTAPAVHRDKNTIDLGFRNMANCPLNGYFARADPSADNAICSETFKFHLGTQPSNAADYMWSWESPTKFEGTFIGHTFSFRLAANPEVLVDTVTVQPTFVPSCPKSKTATVEVHSRQVTLSTEEPTDSMLDSAFLPSSIPPIVSEQTENATMSFPLPAMGYQENGNFEGKITI